jgi:hypothetical protein
MENYKLLETVSDIAYQAGETNYFSGNSRTDVADFILWAKEFEAIHAQTNWLEQDYLLAVREFTQLKMAEASVV